MKKIIIWGIVILILIVSLFFDHRAKKVEFESLKKEYELSVGFERITGLVNIYFFEHGWFPDSLQQIDTIFNRKIKNNNLEDIRDTPYRFLVDPFSGEFYRYIPIINQKYHKPEGYYLLSAGIDSKIDNEKLNNGGLRVYDSLNFDYLDIYFGRKDLIVSQDSIENWLDESSGFEFSLKELWNRYDPTGRRKLPRNIKFYGVVVSLDADYFLVKDIQSGIEGACYLAPSIGQLAVVPGDTLEVKGIYNKTSFLPDTVFTFLNCIILKRNEPR